jgi:hypothetical protein
LFFAAKKASLSQYSLLQFRLFVEPVGMSSGAKKGGILSKQNRVNNDHYTLNGRDTVPKEAARDVIIQEKKSTHESDHSRNFIPGAAPVGEKKEKS